MAASTGILLTAGAIGVGNEWLHGYNTTAVRIGVATAASCFIFAGIEQIPGAAPFAVGLAWIALVSVLLGSVNHGVPSPLLQILDFMGYKPGSQFTATLD